VRPVRCFVTPLDISYKHFKMLLKTCIRDRLKFGFGFGAEDNNLNRFGKFRFWLNIDL